MRPNDCVTQFILITISGEFTSLFLIVVASSTRSRSGFSSHQQTSAAMEYAMSIRYSPIAHCRIYLNLNGQEELESVEV